MNYVFQFGDVWAAKGDLLRGAWLTIQLSASAMVLGLLVAVVRALGKTVGPKPIRSVVEAYIEVIRNTPFLIQAQARIPEQADKYPAQLSGGQQQPMAIARAVYAAQGHAVR